MSKVRFELDRAGVRALMRSPEMQAVLKARADTVKDRCGDGYEAYVAQTRAVAVVETATRQAAPTTIPPTTPCSKPHQPAGRARPCTSTNAT